MLSLDNAFSEEDVRDFDRRIHERLKDAGAGEILGGTQARRLGDQRPLRGGQVRTRRDARRR